MIPPRGQKVSILGLGVSGTQSSLFLKRQGYDIYASDSRDHEDLKKVKEQLSQLNILVDLGFHDLERILGSDWIVISPGISPFSELVKKISERAVPIYSDIEVASWYSASKNIVAVTGTAGKTTMASLLTHLFRHEGRRVFCCGNIGNPWISEIEQIYAEDIIVLELSSFQLFYCQSFKPHVGILMNISPNHLDWHLKVEHYLASKLNLFKFQIPSDFAILRQQDQRAFFPDLKFPAQAIYFDQDSPISPSASVLREVARIYGFPQQSADLVLKEFPGIEHRLERVGRFQEVEYINDSKCTTPLSLSWALRRYPDGKVLLLAGGRAKSKDFESLREPLARKVKKIFLFGESRDYIAKAWAQSAPIQMFNQFDRAIEQASKEAESGDIVLLSPACASFDMFKNYEERGRLFKERVVQLFSFNSSIPSSIPS